MQIKQEQCWTEVTFDSSWQKRGHILVQKIEVNDVSVGMRKTTKKYLKERYQFHNIQKFFSNVESSSQLSNGSNFSY